MVRSSGCFKGASTAAQLFPSNRSMGMQCTLISREKNRLSLGKGALTDGGQLHLGLFEQGSGQGCQLLLACRQRSAAFAHHHVEPLRQAFYISLMPNECPQGVVANMSPARLEHAHVKV